MPGIYLIGQVVAELDKLLGGAFLPDDHTRAYKALEVAALIKTLIQKSRRASRRTVRSRDEELAGLKAMFVIRKQVYACRTPVHQSVYNP